MIRIYSVWQNKKYNNYNYKNNYIYTLTHFTLFDIKIVKHKKMNSFPQY
jgi:hypothetical protein